ncbi:MAG: DNA starvation/stationary phase protection protein Dps [Chloroflexi bacterium]|nr:DNA starvation/stationary phase protection protein Dps [Chloroflexota bacterium]MCC6893081.1 DNA starvation/stationary phase protection protein Dps [Anaerolineae bacterium]
MPKTKTRTFHTHVDLPEDTRDQMVDLLNQQLADMFDLYSQTKQAHWNIKGMDFIQLHEFFDDLAEKVLPYVDEIAERATAIGGLATGTARMAASNSTLPEFPNGPYDGKSMVEALVEAYGHVANSLRAAIDTAEEAGDADTTDLFTQISGDMDKHLWFLEAHIQV